MPFPQQGPSMAVAAPEQQEQQQQIAQGVSTEPRPLPAEPAVMGTT
jgi:hypothetical protein